MPLVRVSRRAGHPAAENKRLLDAVHGALVEAFKIPEITAFPGRSVGAKRALYQGLARRFEAAKVSPRDLFVVVTDPPLENWSPRDGVSSANVKPGFKLDV